MSIKFTSGAPKDTHGKIHGWESELMRASAKGSGGGDPLTLGDAYEVKYLALQGIAAGDLLGAVHTSQWRRLVLHGPHPHGELEFDDAHEPIALHEGPGKDGLRAALEAAENLGDDFEVCVLQAAPLRFVALWLHNDSCDWIMPYAPNATLLVNYATVSVADALAVLQPMAADVMKASAGADPTGG